MPLAFHYVICNQMRGDAALFLNATLLTARESKEVLTPQYIDRQNASLRVLDSSRAHTVKQLAWQHITACPSQVMQRPDLLLSHPVLDSN